MFNEIFCKINPTKDKFLDELLKRDFNENILNSLLKSGIDINCCDDRGDTFLNICINKKRIKASLWLIGKECNLAIKNKNGQSSIQLAVKQGNIKIVKALLSMKTININETNSEGRTILHDAVINGETEIVNELIKHSADVNIVDKNNRNVLFDAIAFGEDKLISKILSTGELDINIADSNGHTVLHNHEVLENDELAKKLLYYGADPTINDKEGKNFLFHTALRGEEGMELLDIAIDKGCNLNGRIRNNNSILMEIMFAFASISDAEKERRSGLMEMAKKFVKNGIDINAINNQGETVLFDAVRKNDVEATAFLLEDGVDVNKRNKRFETALSIAVLKGVEALDVILLLMDYGADVTIKVKDLKTILEVLNDIILHTHGNHSMENQNLLAQIDIDDGQYLIVLRDILSKLRIKLDYNDFAGNPIYFKALLHGNINLFRLYIKYGVDTNKRNSKGRTLFHEYVIYSFKNKINADNFKETLLLLSNIKVDANAQLKDGKTILSHLLLKKCDVELFKVLVNVIRFNYKIQDSMGRTLVHSCVTGGNIELLTIINTQDYDVINIPDYFGMLPLTYAALMGNTKFVLRMINLNSHIISKKKITLQAIEIFSQLLPNLNKLEAEIYDLDDLRKIGILINQIKSDFNA